MRIGNKPHQNKRYFHSKKKIIKQDVAKLKKKIYNIYQNKNKFNNSNQEK
jgi:hypothetical protein